MRIEDAQFVLQQIVHTSKKYNEIAKITGERFNIFQILDVSTEEVRMHSAFVCELLNPNGNHGCGNLFLDSFLKQQSSKHESTLFSERLKSFVTIGCRAKVEHTIGRIKNDGTEGGRIDIILTDKQGNHIIIENKINAGDQPKQLVRYNNFAKAAPIFYLTLDGSEPSDASIGSLKNENDFRCISYKADIKDWLISCLKEAAQFPLLRETINQYINLINSLTGQTIDNNMAKEINNLLLENDDFLESAFTLSNTIESVKNERAILISNAIEKKIKDKALACKVSPHYYTFPRIEFYPDNWRTHLIGYTNANGLMYGVKRVDSMNKPVTFDQIKDCIGSDWKTSDWWLCYKPLNKGTFNILSAQPWLKKNEEELVSTIIQQIESLLERTKAIQL
jgi:hypothetical protein